MARSGKSSKMTLRFPGSFLRVARRFSGAKAITPPVWSRRSSEQGGGVGCIKPSFVIVNSLPTASAFTFDLAKGSDLLVVDATARPGVSVDALEHGVSDILDELRVNGLRNGELDRVLAQTETDFATSMQSAGDRAEQLSRFATYFGDPRLLNDQVARYRGVTKERVDAIAQERLGPDNRASLVYVPRPGGGS